LTASLAPISNLTIPAQQGYTLPLNGSGTPNAQTFTVTSSNPDLAASIAQGPFWTINVQYTDPTNSQNNFSGPLTFQLFQNLTPNTVSQIQLFTNDGYYTGKPFTRVATGFPGPTDYVVQGGAVNSNGTGNSGQPGTPFANENVQTLAFTGQNQLAMANAGGTNSNDTQFFITTGSPNSELGYNYTIFGQMVSGLATLAKMTQIPVQPNPALGNENSLPVNSLIMSSVSLSPTNPNGALILDTTQAKPGETSTITVTATDPTDGSQVSQSFTATAGAYAGPTDPAINFRPFANPVTASVAGTTPTNITLAGQSGYPDTSRPSTLSYSLVTQPSHGTISNFNAAAGTLTYTPSAGFQGTDTFQYQVTATGPQATPATTLSNPGTVTLTVTGAPQVLVITAQPPASVPAGAAFGLTVTVEDSSGNVLPSFSGAVTVALASNPGGATLGGTLTVNAVNGVATFSNLTLNQPATGYTLQVNSGSLPPATTAAFTVTPTSPPVNTGAVRLVGPVLIVTPLPHVGHRKNTIDVIQTANSSTATTGGPFIQVVVNGQLDINQPSTDTTDSIVVFGAKSGDRITIDPSVTLPATIDAGHGGRNVLKGGGGFTREHGWFGFTTLIGGPGPNQLIGRAGQVRFKPSKSTNLIFAGVPHNRTAMLNPTPPGGTFYEFKRGRLIPVPISALFPKKR